MRKTSRELEKQVRTGYELELLRIKQNFSDADCDRKIPTKQQHSGNLDENVFEQQASAPCARQEPIHKGARRVVVRVPLVIKADQETRVEDNHR